MTRFHLQGMEATATTMVVTALLVSLFMVQAAATSAPATSPAPSRTPLPHLSCVLKFSKELVISFVKSLVFRPSQNQLGHGNHILRVKR